MEDWQNKPMQGQFLRQTGDLSSNDTWQWLQTGELKKETEEMVMAAQEQALKTRYIQRAIDGTNISPKCRKCNQKDWNLCKKYQMPCSNKWYEHQPQPVTGYENAKLLCIYSIRTNRVIPAHQVHQPDLTLVNKTINKVSLIDVAVPWDSRAKQNEQEKKINTKT